MGEGPKDMRDDAGRFDAPRHDDMIGRGDADLVGRAAAETEPLTPAAGVYPPGPSMPPATRGGYAAGGTTAAETTPETSEIRAEIEQKRADISETIDEITQRLSPGHIVSQATDSMKDTARTTMRRVADTAGQTAEQVAGSTRRAGRTAMYQVREHPWSAGAILAGVGAATWWMMSRRSSGVEEWDVDDYTEESLYYDDGQLDSDRGSRFVGVVRDNPVPIALTTIGLGWWMWNQRARGRRAAYGSGSPASRFDAAGDRYGYGAAGADAGAYRRFDSERGVWVSGEQGTEATTERVKEAMSDATARARETMDDVSERTREAASRAQRQIGEYTSRAQQQIGRYSRQATSQLQYWMEHNPLAVGAVAMAVGAAVGLALPETRREQLLMGDARDRVVDNAKELANQAVDRATQAAHSVVGTAMDAANTTSSTADTANDAINRASQAAKDTLNRLD